MKQMKHLTDEKLAGWLGGDGGEETNSHLAQCAQCRSEAVQVRDGISRYALAMRREADRAQSAHLPGDLAFRNPLALHRLRWAGAGVLALLLAAPTAWMMRPHPLANAFRPTVTAPLEAPPAAPMSDDELLEAVNNDLSREVPQALAPVSAITTARNQIAAASMDTVNNGNAFANKEK